MRIHSPTADRALISGLRKGAWTREEDTLLREYVEMYGARNWRDVSQRAGLNRCRKSCRMRWLNYLCPAVKRGPFEEDEEDLIIRLHKLLGNRWSLIAGRIPGRTANDVKNHWNTHLRKRLHADQPKKETSDQRLKVIKPQPRLIPRNWTWSNDQVVPLGEQHNLALLVEHHSNAADHEDCLDFVGEFDFPVFGSGGEAVREEDLQTNAGVDDIWKTRGELLSPKVGGWENLFSDTYLLEDLLYL